jgi:hypothetical protein
MTPEEMLVAGVRAWVEHHPITISVMLFWFIYNSRSSMDIVSVLIVIFGIRYGW